MPRNSSGTYTLPESAFVSGTVIRSSPMNNDLSDIATALTQSLATTGVSSMTGPIKAASGSLSAPSYTFASALGTGFYLSGSNEFAWVANGVLGATFKSDLSVTWVGNATYSGNLTVSGTLSTGATTFSATNDPILTLDNTTNDALEHEIFRLKLGDGTGAQASRRVIGSGANNITEIRDYVGTTKALAITSNGLSLIGFANFPEISTPVSASANVAKLYAADDGAGVTNLFWIDENGVASGTRNATQTEMEAATTTQKTVTPGRQHFHPGHPKAVIAVNESGVTLYAYNVSAVSKISAGRYSVSYSINFGGVSYALVGGIVHSGASVAIRSFTNKSAGGLSTEFQNSGGSDVDCEWSYAIYGDLP